MAELADAADSKADHVKDNLLSSRKHSGESGEIEGSETENGNSREINSGVDVIEAALAEALTEATRAQRFDVVAQICRELEARRLQRSPNVVDIFSKRGTHS